MLIQCSHGVAIMATRKSFRGYNRFMAITRSATQPNPEHELSLVINNGDLQALKDAVKKLGFKDEEGVLRFALAVLTKSATRSLTIVDKDGNRVSLSPATDLLKPAETVPQS